MTFSLTKFVLLPLVAEVFSVAALLLPSLPALVSVIGLIKRKVNVNSCPESIELATCKCSSEESHGRSPLQVLP